MKESDLYEQLARYLSLKHPELEGRWHFDLAGVNNPSKYTRALYGRLNKRAWPDLLIAQPAYFEGTPYHGLFIELKREGTRTLKRNGEYASEHIAEQADMLGALGVQGYIAQFAVGYDEAVSLIEGYMAGAEAVSLTVDEMAGEF